jgi:hypothetical protein
MTYRNYLTYTLLAETAFYLHFTKDGNSAGLLLPILFVGYYILESKNTKAMLMFIILSALDVAMYFMVLFHFLTNDQTLDEKIAASTITFIFILAKMVKIVLANRIMKSINTN